MSCNQIDIPRSRREFLQTAGGGFGAVALAALMSEQAQAAPVRLAQRVAKAKSVILQHGKIRLKNLVIYLQWLPGI